MWAACFGQNLQNSDTSLNFLRLLYHGQLQCDRAVHRVFPPPKFHFKNPKLDFLWIRFYWTLRTAQFKILYEDEESDLDSIHDLLKYEPSTRPPSVEEMVNLANGQFSKKWIKYMYGRFKAECPCGRMKLFEFKKLFSEFLPDRLSDAYLERMFHAICHKTQAQDDITFKDLIQSLAMLQCNDPYLNAEWMMRLINPHSYDRITFDEFHEFVKSIFLLVGRENRTRTNSVLSDDYKIDHSISSLIFQRSNYIFSKLDTKNNGYITINDLESYFTSNPISLGGNLQDNL